METCSCKQRYCTVTLTETCSCKQHYVQLHLWKRAVASSVTVQLQAALRCSCKQRYVAVASSVTLQLLAALRYSYTYGMIFITFVKVQHKLNIVSGSAPVPGCAPATNYYSRADDNATVTCHHAAQSVERPAFDSWLRHMYVQTGSRVHTICSPVGSERSFPEARKSLTSI
jgi:hypothetical protein